MKVDPSQTKTVIALLVALAVAIGVTVARISRPSAPPQPVAEARGEDAERAQACATASVECDPARNPFARPNLIQAASKSMESALESGAAGMLSDTIKVSPWRVNDVEPISQGDLPVPAAAKTSALQTTVQVEKEPLPQFDLMATVKGSRGYSAVIRTNQSETRVVEVGDRMECGFKVARIEPDRATLTDGTDIVTAKRPMGSDERRVESGERHVL